MSAVSTATGSPAAVATAVAEEHLELLGLREAARAIDWRADWHRADDPAPDGSEATCQALGGLMALHGAGVPRRLGLDVASTAAGVLAAQGVLAGLLARARGGQAPAVRTSVLDGALALAGHRLAVATAAGARPERPAAGTRPPFATSDGHWVELEAVRYEGWRDLFLELGAEEADIDAGWAEFARRYVTGRCALPAALHSHTRTRTLADLEAAAARNGVAACRLRSYADLMADGWGGCDEPWSIRRGAHDALVPLSSPRAAPPLDGILVVELTTRLQGPLAGHLLRMLGADVIKVEPPGGDPGRMARGGPFRAAYLALNSGKRFAEIDYKTAAGLRDLQELAAGADVFLHNSRPGRAERLGLSYEQLQRTAPGIVHAQLAGWDPHGPRAGEVAGDYIVQAASGCGWGVNEHGTPPFPSPVTLLDVTAGLLACEAVLAGLVGRALHGRGAGAVTTLESAASVLQRDVLRALAGHGGGTSGRRFGSPLWGPLDRPIATAAGWLVVSAPRGPARLSLADACGTRPGAGDDELAARLASGSAAGWEEQLAAAGVPAARVREDLAELPGDVRVGACLEPLGDDAWAPAPPWRFLT